MHSSENDKDPPKRAHKRSAEEVRQSLPPILGDWIFLASGAQLGEACRRENLRVDGARVVQLQRLVKAFAPAEDFPEQQRMGRTPASHTNTWALEEIYRLRALVADLSERVDSLTAASEACGDEHAVPAEGEVLAQVVRVPAVMQWVPSAEIEEIAPMWVADAVASAPLWTRLAARGDVETMFWMQDQLEARSCNAPSMWVWLSLGHIIPRRKPIVFFTKEIIRGGVNNVSAIACRRHVQAVAQVFENKETRYDVARPTGGLPSLIELVESGAGHLGIVDHAAKLASVSIQQLAPSVIETHLPEEKGKLPVLHRGARYLRGHHLRQIDAHASRCSEHEWCQADWDILAFLLPGTLEGAMELGIASFQEALHCLAWLNAKLPAGTTPLRLRDLTMSLCLRPKRPRAHKDTGLPFDI